MRVMDRVGIQTVELAGREEDNSLVTMDLAEKVLLLIVVTWCYVACKRTIYFYKLSEIYFLHVDYVPSK